MMDSTFMGTMAGMALRLKELGQGRLHVIHCGERSRDLLSGLGLDQIFDIQANGAAAPQCETLTKANGRSGASRADREARAGGDNARGARGALPGGAGKSHSLQGRPRIPQARPPAREPSEVIPASAPCVFFSSGCLSPRSSAGSHLSTAALAHPPARALERGNPGRGKSRLRFSPRPRRSFSRCHPAARSASLDRRKFGPHSRCARRRALPGRSHRHEVEAGVHLQGLPAAGRSARPHPATGRLDAGRAR